MIFELLTNELPPNRDYITTGGLIICALLSAFSAVIVALVQSNRNMTKRGMKAAEVAAVRSEPTGNGWADEVKDTLERIEAKQAEQSRDIGGIREEQRTERVERVALAYALSKHIERNDT